MDISASILETMDGQLVRKGEIPTIAANLILDVIEKEEGGWEYTDHKDDPDAGTFAGVRFITWKRWLGLKNPELRVIGLHDFMTFANQYENRQDIIFLIYWDLYAKPCSLELYHPKMAKAVLSVAINSGVQRAGILVQRAVNECEKSGLHFGELDEDGVIGPKSQSSIGVCASDELLYWFLYYWRAFYAELVVENARMWKDWGEAAMYMGMNRGKFTNAQMQAHYDSKPKYFRATFLQGWLNRIEKTQGWEV